MNHGIVYRPLRLLLITALAGSCVGERSNPERATSSALTATVSPVATVTVIGTDTLSDSARIHRLEPEPDGASIAFLFADPVKGVTSALGIVQTSGNQAAQLAWPDSVLAIWWSNRHQLSFIAGTGRGLRVVVDAHATQLQAIETKQGTPTTTERGGSKQLANALSRAQAFLDSVRVQPDGRPQQSTLHYRADSILIAPNDSIAAVHASAEDSQGNKVNPAWYLIHLSGGHVRAIDSLTGRSLGLAPSAGQWGANGSFYYTKERSIWRAEPAVQ